MAHDFPMVALEDVDGVDVTIQAITIPVERPHLVKLVTGDACWGKPAYLDSGAARAAARALLEAADEADQRTSEDAALDARCQELEQLLEGGRS